MKNILATNVILAQLQDNKKACAKILLTLIADHRIVVREQHSGRNWTRA